MSSIRRVLPPNGMLATAYELVHECHLNLLVIGCIEKLRCVLRLCDYTFTVRITTVSFLLCFRERRDSREEVQD